MALNKQITLPNGVIVKYHRIDSINLYTYQSDEIITEAYINKSGDVVPAVYQSVTHTMLNAQILQYVDKSYRDQSTDNFAARDTIQIEITSEASETNLRGLAYSELKNTLKYTAATDC